MSLVLGIVATICLFLIPGVVGSEHYIIGLVLIVVLYNSAMLSLRLYDKEATEKGKGKR